MIGSMFSTVSTTWPRPERPGAEARDRAARTERRLVDLGAVEGLQPVAVGIVEGDQRAHAPRIGQRLRLGGDGDAGALQLRRQRIERCAVGDLPAEEARAVAHGAVDHDALLAVVHPEGEQGIAALDRLEAEQVGAELPPVVELVRPEAGISQISLIMARLLHVPALCPGRLRRACYAYFWARPPRQRSLDGPALPWCLRQAMSTVPPSRRWWRTS